MGLKHKVTTNCEHLKSFEHAVFGALYKALPPIGTGTTIALDPTFETRSVLHYGLANLH
jgi:hypothetical protein